MSVSEKEYGKYTVSKERLLSLIKKTENLNLSNKDRLLIEWVLDELDFKDNVERLRLLKTYPYFYCLNPIKGRVNEFQPIRFTYKGMSHKQALKLLRKEYRITPRIVGSSFHIQCIQDAGLHEFIDTHTKYNYWARIKMYETICSIDFDNENIIHYDLKI